MNRVKYKIISILMIAIVICASLSLGQFLGATSSYAADQGLGSNGKYTWTTIASTDTIKVAFKGVYQVTVEGGSARNAFGGKLLATIPLEKGDILKTQKYTGGLAAVQYANGGCEKGGDAMALYVNNVLVIGAGGAGGGANFKTQAVFPNGEGVKEINNTKFSSGAGGVERVNNSVTSGKNGEGPSNMNVAKTGPNLNGWQISEAGCNFLDTSKMSLVIQPNNGTTAMVTIQLDTLSTLVEHLDASTTVGSKTTAPIQLAVCANQPFSVPVMGYDSLATATMGQVTLENTSQTDKYIVIKGKIPTAGVTILSTQGVDIMISVLEEPKSSNVKVTLT